MKKKKKSWWKVARGPEQTAERKKLARERSEAPRYMQMVKAVSQPSRDLCSGVKSSSIM